jgi:hypothetical protein
MSLPKFVKKNFKPLWIIGILLLLGAIGWALDPLEAQSNKSAANAGSMSSDMSMASMDSIKKPQATAKKPAPNVNWGQESSVKASLTQQEKAIADLTKRANNEQASNGAVSSGLAGQLQTAGQKYLDTSKQYSEIWAAGNCKTRAKLALEAGQTQYDAIQVLIAGADSDKISALNSSQDRLNDARRAYFKEAVDNGELSAADKSQIVSSIQPRINKLVTDATGLISEVTSLLDQIRSQAGSLTSPDAIVGGVTACAAGGGGGPENIATKLLSPITNLLTLSKGLLSGAQGFVSDLALLK